MNNIKKILIAALLFIISTGHIYCQTIEWNEDYTYTVFYDDFSNSQIDLNKWRVEDGAYLHHTLFIDSSATISVANGNLRLTTISCPNCSSGGVTKNHAAGKITTNEYFQYGIFESRIYFARKEGTSAYFELRGGNGIPCGQDGLYENEIYIANSWWRQIYPYYHLSHTINHYHIGTDCVDDYEIVNKHSYERSSSSTYLTYKCVWTPSYIRYYLGGTLVHEVLNTGSKCPECNQEWFPEYPMQLSLYQTLNHDVPLYIDVPQTTYVDYVSVKKFFVTPEITLSSDVICTNGSALLDVDSDALNISWSLSPAGLFTGATSGSGKDASINVGSANGEGKITYTFDMPGGDSFEIDESFWVGSPAFTGLIHGDISIPLGSTEQYWVNASEIHLQQLSVYDWDVTSNLDMVSSHYFQQDVYVEGVTEGRGTVYFNAINTCGSTQSSLPVRVTDMLLLSITPNPTNEEAILTIESASGEKTTEEDTEWDLEIYSESMML